MRYPPIGKAGQQRLADARVLLCGCGALGSVLANTLARAGVGRLKIVDRDLVEITNLQRQVLFDEEDVAQGVPKAVAAARKLARINSEVEIEPVVADVDPTNIAEFASRADMILDGTDNFETRFLLNDYCVKHNVPWVYGGSIGAEGQVMTILPGVTPCLRCLMQDVPPPGTTPTCDTAGVLGPIVNVVASIQAVEALKVLSGNRDAICRKMYVFELWKGQARQVGLDALLQLDCPTCKRREFEWLDGKRTSRSVVLCGRNAVQLRLADRDPVPLTELAERLRQVGTVVQNEFLLRLETGECELTVFPDGRTIVHGTDDPARAKTLHAKYVGN